MDAVLDDLGASDCLETSRFIVLDLIHQPSSHKTPGINPRNLHLGRFWISKMLINDQIATYFRRF